MSKCLVTKLKAVVDNPNLPVFGALSFTITSKKDIPAYRMLQVYPSTYHGVSITIVVSQGALYSDENTNEKVVYPGHPYVISSTSYNAFYFKKGEKTTFHILDYSNTLGKLFMRQSKEEGLDLSLEKFYHCKHLFELDIRFCDGITGSISELLKHLVNVRDENAYYQMSFEIRSTGVSIGDPVLEVHGTPDLPGIYRFKQSSESPFYPDTECIKQYYNRDSESVVGAIYNKVTDTWSNV